MFGFGRDSLIYDYLESNYFDHIFMIFYVLNFIFAAIAYKLGFARKLPLLKSVFVYIMLFIGSFILALFSSIAKLPITESLIIISLVLAVYRFRLSKERKRKANT